MSVYNTNIQGHLNILYIKKLNNSDMHPLFHPLSTTYLLGKYTFPSLKCPFNVIGFYWWFIMWLRNRVRLGSRKIKLQCASNYPIWPCTIYFIFWDTASLSVKWRITQSLKSSQGHLWRFLHDSLFNLTNSNYFLDIYVRNSGMRFSLKSCLLLSDLGD